jgi:hypothetical protein
LRIIVCADVTESFDPTTIPSYTADCNPQGTIEYELPGSVQRVRAVTFSAFLDNLTDVDLDHVDTGLLTVACAPVTH